MRGSEFSAIRARLGLSEARFAALLGYTGTPRNNQTRIREYERDKKQIPLYIARLAWLIHRIVNVRHVPVMDGEIKFPEWPGYEFDHQPDEEVTHER